MLMQPVSSSGNCKREHVANERPNPLPATVHSSCLTKKQLHPLNVSKLSLLIIFELCLFDFISSLIELEENHFIALGAHGDIFGYR